MHGGSAPPRRTGSLPRAPVDLPPEVYSAVHGPSGAGDARDDEFERAMALNEQLKAMLGEDAATTAEQFAASAVKPRGVADENDPRANQDMEYAMDAPTHGRRARRARAGPRRSAAAAAAPAAKAPARGPARRKPASYTFGNEKLKEIGRDNRILLEKMARITLEGSGPNAAVAPRVPRKKVVASESINRRRRNDKIANENAVRAACPPGTHALLVTRGAAPQQAIARRLASVKASSALSRPSMNQHKKKHKKLLRNMRDPSVSRAPRRAGSVMQQSGRRSVASGRRSAEPSTGHRPFEYIP